MLWEINLLAIWKGSCGGGINQTDIKKLYLQCSQDGSIWY